MLVDTDVLIWHFRGNTKAQKILNEQGAFDISAVVYMEILQGLRNKKELSSWQHFVIKREINVLPISAEITSRAIYLLEKYALGHGLKMADALIAATTDLHGETLLTGNFSHYQMIPALNIKKFHV
jgi:predicted nucleic acid-binding protein